MKKKMDCSKKILLSSYILTISLTLFMVIGIVVKLDVSPIENVCLASWGELAAANIWYFTKAKVENQLKIITSLPDNFKEQVDINQIINK